MSTSHVRILFHFLNNKMNKMFVVPIEYFTALKHIEPQSLEVISGIQHFTAGLEERTKNHFHVSGISTSLSLSLGLDKA